MTKPTPCTGCHCGISNLLDLNLDSSSKFPPDAPRTEESCRGTEVSLQEPKKIPT